MRRVPSRSAVAPLDPIAHLLASLLLASLLSPTSGAAAVITADGATCTLAEAIAAANADNAGGNGCANGSGADEILLQSDVVLAAADPGSPVTLGGQAGLPDVTSTITVRADGGSVVARDAALDCAIEDPTAFRLFQVTAPGSLTLDGITVRNGCIAPPPNVIGYGGGVLAQDGSTLTLLGGVVEGNFVRGGRGAGANGANARGGGVAALDATVVVAGTSFSDNQARGGRSNSGAGWGEGGALMATGSTAVEIDDALLTGNTASGGQCTAACPAGWGIGGAIRALFGSTLVVRDSQLVGNTAEGGDTDDLAGAGVGGALSTETTTTLERLVLRENLATGGVSAIAAGGLGSGGALHALGAMGLLVLDSLFLDNVAQGTGSNGGSGGAVSLISAPATLDGCTFSGNQALSGEANPPLSSTGGAVAASGTFTVEIARSTFADNLARGGDHAAIGPGGNGLGGAIYAGAPIALSQVTIAGNQANGGVGPGGTGAALGAGLSTVLSAVTVDNTLLAGNTITSGGFQGPQDCWDAAGVITSAGYNLVSEVGNCTFAATGDQTGATVGDGLRPLADYGCHARLPDGTCLPTMALSTASPALDGGSCATSGADADQRGAGRPQDHPAAANADDGCDVGAFELDPGGFHTVTPCRVLDTRLVGDAPALSHLVPRNVPVHGRCAIPASAVAVTLNATVTGAASGGHVVLYPGGAAVPATSTLNFIGGDTRANNAILPLSADGLGTLDARAFLNAGSGTVHLILDVTGYFE